MTGEPTAAWARRVLVAVHVPAVGVPVVFTVINHPEYAVAAVALGLAIGTVQLRHSLATAAGHRPRGWWWTLPALAVMVYAPLIPFGLNWGVTQTALIASALMLLRPWAATAVIAGVLVAAATYAATVFYGRGGFGRLAYDVTAALVFDIVVGVALYGAVRLVRVLEELAAARTELAELAVGRERLRVSRDLHDLLGQSLSAVSLKGDLAIRLLHADPPAARAEIESLTGVARQALRGVRLITRDEHVVSLREEVDGAGALLAAAGVSVRVAVDADGLRPAHEEVLAWAVREGVTNVLRHSAATECAVTAGRRDGAVHLAVVNDGAGADGQTGGTGLAGLGTRAAAVGGTVTAGPGAGDTFRLAVRIPEEDA